MSEMIKTSRPLEGIRGMRLPSRESFVLVVLLLLVAVVSFSRIFLGVEITDEAYYIGDARLVAHGAVPFVDNWMPGPGFVIFFSWLVSLFEFITGSTEGLFLYMRVAFWLFRVACLGTTYMILRKSVSHKVLVLFLLPFMLFTPISMLMFSYNTIPFFLMLVMQALLWRMVMVPETRWRGSAIALGIILAGICLAHPYTILVIVYSAALLVVTARLKGQSLVPALLVVVSGFAAALLVIVILSVLGGGMTRLWAGIHSILEYSPYFDFPSRSSVIGSLKSIRRQCFEMFLMSFVVFVLGVYARVRGKSHGTDSVNYSGMRKVILWGFLAASIAYTLYLVFLEMRHQLNVHGHVQCAFFFVPVALLVWLPTRYVKTGIVLLLTVWIPCILQISTYALIAFDGIQPRYYLLYPGSILSIPFFWMALSGIGDSGTSAFRTNLRKIAVVLLSVALLCSAGTRAYTYFYRESPLSELKYRVEQGVYRGLYTTEERSVTLVALENELRAITQSDDCVLFMEVVPMAYLMTDAQFCTPTTWDLLAYSYGANDDRIMQEYFRTIGRYPTKIIYIHTGRDEILSIDSDGYHFNEFVNAHYDLTYEHLEGRFPIKMYELQR